MQKAKHTGKQSQMDRLVVVSNRLPFSLARGKDGEWRVEPSKGGLVSALTPVLQEMGGVWIGWPGALEEVEPEEIATMGRQGMGYEIKPVLLTEEEVDEYYHGFSNEIIWPLFHDLQNFCNFDPAYWAMYQAVNGKFARVVADNVRERDFIWVHDYHLMLAAKELHSIGVRSRVGFFLHTPFPPPDIFIKLPWRRQIMEALLEFDLLGFQTVRDRNNFAHCLEALIKGHRYDARRQVLTLSGPGRRARVGAFPISIDYKEFVRQASSAPVDRRARELRQAMPDRQIVLGVDRLDYSKGIRQKLHAFRYALDHFDDLHGKVTLVQVVVPSREDIPEYQDLKGEVEGLVSETNGRFTQAGWVPIHYMYRNLERTELLAYYRLSDIALVTPLKDGMNLVAKEYCAANVDRNGVLVLSEFAGAATQLRRSALIVNPYDIEGVAGALHRAFHMGMTERRAKMQRLQRTIRRRDIFWWVDFFLREATG